MSSKMRNSARLKIARNLHVSSLVTGESIHQYLSSLGTPRALSVWLLFSNKEHSQLLDLDIDPHFYVDPCKFRDDYCATLFLSKADFLDLPFDRDTVAFEKFNKFELLCRHTNLRFKNPILDPLKSDSSEWLLNATTRKINRILSDFSGDEFCDEANWGPGSSTRLSGSEVSAVNKFQSEIGITRDLYSLIQPWFQAAYPLWESSIRITDPKNVSFEVGNKIVTVPKNSKTNRVIAIEPGLNLWFQKAIGSMIRRRLGREGVNLQKQEINQRLAYIGSKDLRLATIDFSSASDSISIETVRAVLPPRWFQLLDTCRSHYGKNQDSVQRWNKFSSMGNGFTFELESLIFYAAAVASMEYNSIDPIPGVNVSVYGDDVIIPVDAVETFSEFCEFLGFKVNTEKSFSSSNFRESCGSHYFSGLDCKPVFLKERLRNVESLYKLANSIRYLAHRSNLNYGCDARFRTCWLSIYGRVPKPLRFKIPFGLGDGGFICNFDEAVPSRARHGIEGFFVEHLTSLSITKDSEHLAVLMARLKVRSIMSLKNSYSLRSRVKRSISRSLVPTWYDLGPWL